ncbi:MAG: Bug family tripartite tricarboxylate transporter substrate binding protein [Usitatibacter sp.]
MTRTLRRIAALLAATAAVTALAEYPDRPITLVVPFAAGGPTDTLARIFAQRMSKRLGQTIVVENVAGAGGIIANNKVMHAAPDGYTVEIGHVGTHVLAPAVQSVEADYLADFEPVGMIASNPEVIVVNPKVPAKTLKEFVAYVKANPGKVSYGTGGPGTPAHVMAVDFGTRVGAPLNIIHYKGAGPAMQDVIAGHVDSTFDQAATGLNQARAGRVVALAVTSPHRLASAPDIPTVDEAGLPGFYMSVWHALWVPKGTPREVIAKLNAASREALADPAIRKQWQELGQEVPALDEQTPEALRAHHKAEIDKWWPIIKAAGIKS